MGRKEPPSMADFAIADTHFMYGSVLKRDPNSDFRSIAERDAYITRRWNATVTKDDRVYILGDIGINDPKELGSIVKSLSGEKILIIGNHDHMTDEQYAEAGISKVERTPIFYRDNVVFSHAPLPFLPGYVLNVHGHLHKLRLKDQNYVNVSVDCLAFSPALIEPLIRKAASLKRICDKFGKEWWAESYDDASAKMIEGEKGRMI
jgi:calcineurin-like phosphoesterase family protein